MMSAAMPPAGPVASATSDPIFHNSASAAAIAGSLLRSSGERRQFTRNKYSSIPKMTDPAQCPIVLTRTGSWILSQSGILVLTISNFSCRGYVGRMTFVKNGEVLLSFQELLKELECCFEGFDRHSV